jgi:hypothetical protein
MIKAVAAIAALALAVPALRAQPPQPSAVRAPAAQATGAARPDEPLTLTAVLERAAAYTSEFEERLSGIVAEEDYVQDVDAFTRFRPEFTHRELLSDLLLVRLPEAGRYVEFRDVAEVDGLPVRDRAERVTRLFLSSLRGDDQLRSIIAESARYNIGQVERNVNTPLLALLFLEKNFQPHFTFRIAAERTPSLAARGNRPADLASTSFVVPPDVWVIAYEEAAAPPLIRSPEGRAIPAHGRFWIDPADGRLLITELIAGDATLEATINVSYQSEPLLGFSVPVEMRERYTAKDVVITGTATYGHFRRFEVKTQESDVRPADR